MTVTVTCAWRGCTMHDSAEVDDIRQLQLPPRWGWLDITTRSYTQRVPMTGATYTIPSKSHHAPLCPDHAAHLVREVGGTP